MMVYWYSTTNNATVLDATNINNNNELCAERRIPLGEREWWNLHPGQEI
jgi:hypothetical protein